MKNCIIKTTLQHRVILLVSVALLLFSIAYVFAAADGQPVWTGDLPISTASGNQGVLDIPIVASGAGGAIFVWENSGSGNIFAQRVSRHGKILWQEDGLPIAAGPWWQTSPRAVSDGAGGVIVAWVDGRNGSCNPTFAAQCDIFAQRISAEGETLWGASGVPICTAERNQGVNGGIAITSDEAGGAIIVWFDARPPTSCCEVFAQRVDSNGAVKWTQDGMLISPPPPIYGSSPISGIPHVVSDGAGGAIIEWVDEYELDMLPTAIITVQRVDANGQALWASGGILVGTPSNYYGISMTPDEHGGVIIAWNHVIHGEGYSYNEDIFAQRIKSSGQITWQTDGVRVTNEPHGQKFPDVVSDGNGGAIVVWGDERNNSGMTSCHSAYGNCDIFAQRVGAAGQVLWQDNGIPISTAEGNQFLPQIVGDGSQGAIIAWQDCRNTLDDPPCMSNLQCPCIFGMDIFAQRVNTNGQMLWQPDGSPVSIAAENQGVHSGTPLNPGLFIASDGLGGAILAWPDGRNNGCAMLKGFPSNCDLYAQRVTDQFLLPPESMPWIPLLLLED